MRLDESRRLTGPNLFSRLPGAICDVEVSPAEQRALIAAWEDVAQRLTETLGWADSRRFSRQHATGVSLVISAPIDVLYAATDVNEAALAIAIAECRDESPPNWNETVAKLKRLIRDEENPDLLALASAANDHGVRFLTDDDDTSLGYSAAATCWPTRELPNPDAVDWTQHAAATRIPVGLVTGTNGKSTTVRLAASIVAAADRVAGVTSTDYIRVGDEIIDAGDYSGPGGARQLLRHANTEVALLEVARGGMLRRGLGVTDADAALITNVAADHLGEYGIHTVAELRDAKFIVRRGLAPERPLILNADDAGVVAYAQQLNQQRLVWFSEQATNTTVRDHADAGGTAFVIDDGHLTRCESGEVHRVVAVADIPVTLGGKAHHNVQNALAAAALCDALSCDDAAIREGLIAFSGDNEANPGRGNLFRGRGIQAIVDFAHNEHGLLAMAQTVAAMPAKRRLVLMGQAGDRSDELIEGLTQAALAAKPDQLVICQLPGYERGRTPEAVPALIEATARAAGMPTTAIHHALSPIDGTRFALDWAKDGDLLLILALTQRGPCTQMIQRHLG
ncbi:MAG: Mur ligase family protein [Pseudomonadota bacterium]